MYINPLAIATALDEAEGGLVARQYRTRSRGRRLATGAIVGIAIAGFLFVAFCLFCCWFCCFRKKRGSKRAGHQQPISGPTSHGGGGGGFFSKFRPGNGAPPPQGHYAGGPAMQQNGYGAQPGYGAQQPGYGGQQYGYSNGGVAQPQPAYR